MATYETIIKRWDDGIVNDPRSSSGCRVVTNFDILTDPYRMIPYRSSEAGDVNSATSQIQNFAVALRTGTTTYSLYGLGVQSGAATAEVYYKDLTTGSAGDLDDDDWNSTSNQQSASGSTQFNLFVYYKHTTAANSRIYGVRSNRYIWAYDPTGTAGWTDTSKDLNDYSDVFSTSFASHTQGIVHSKDDILYCAFDNWIIKNTDGTWFAGTAPVLTLPRHLKITSMCEYGNYLAIGCAPISGVGKSVVYLWDRDASLTTLSESIDWGEGVLKVLEEVGGLLVGISARGGTTYQIDDKVTFRYLSGNKSKIFDELVGDLGTVANSFPIAKQKTNERLYFMLAITINGAVREGVWSVGRTNEGLSIVHERTPNNDTALSSGSLYGFLFVGDFLFISYYTSSAYAMSKTLTTATYTAKSIYESLIDNGRHKGFNGSITKKLIGVKVMTEFLPTAGQIVLQYQKDEDIGGATWTTIFTEATNSSISFSAINISGVTLPQYKEIQYRIESTGKAVPTGFESQWGIIPKDIYE